jgi:hypothetical protein
MATTEELAKLPDWAGPPFRRFLEDQRQVLIFYQLAIEGISIIYYRFQRVEELAEELKKLNKKSGIESAHEPDEIKEHEEMKKRAEYARREAEQGFPVLNEQATVNLWSALETLVKDLVACWIENVPTARQSEAVRKVRIRLADYEAMSAEERSFYLIDELERDLGAPLRQGVNRFEVLLTLFGLSGELEDDLRRELFELSHVRNVIVHRRGIADRKLVDACPWLALKTGDRVTVTSDAHHRYFDAVHEYGTVLVNRVNRYFAVPPPSPAEEQGSAELSCNSAARVSGKQKPQT